ncbi:hypothetical protein GCM10009821_05440 [Aeromicrobium halocynthiae]|uniref:Alkane 1-monooxygenase n=1 Tax=Aeromicrobium halocynthiae TaxID=560557 RepID=A0ABN2VU66_9ACTN
MPLHHLQRHSDHHANPTRRYQTLRDFEESPVLPTGYAGMIVLALFPPVWRRVMDHRVLAHFNGDLTCANLSPRKRDKIRTRYAAPETTPTRESTDALGSGAAPACILSRGRTSSRMPPIVGTRPTSPAPLGRPPSSSST